MRKEQRIDYVEIPVTDPGKARDFFSEDLERDRDRVVELGATISQDIFSFPGGRRFHFVDPVGTEYAIWSETGAAE